MADTKTQFKLNKLAKDLGLKGKDLMEILSKHGKEVTAQKTLEASEFDILFDTVTRENQIDDVGAYLDGKTYIPSKKKPAKAEKAAEKKPAEEKPAVEPAAEKPSEKVAEKTAEAPVAVEKTAEKPVAKEEKPAEKAEKPAEPSKKAAEAEKSTQKKAEESVAEAKKPASDSVRPSAAVNTEKASGARPQNAGSQQKTNTNPSSGARPAANAASGRTSGGFGANGGYQPRQQSGTAGNGARPYSGGGQVNTLRNPYGQSAQGGFGGNRPQQSGNNRSPFGGNDRFGGGHDGFGGGRSGGQNRSQGNRDRGGRGFDKDKGDFNPGGPRDTFKAQPIVRGAATNVNPDGTLKGPRVVDTRGSSNVDLSKYDEKLETFATDRENDLRGGNQRVKKQSGGQQAFGGKGQFGGKGKKGRGQSVPMQSNVIKRPTSVELPEEIVVGQLASRLMVTAGEVVKKLIMMGMMVTVNQVIEYDYAALVCEEFGVTATKEVVVSIEDKLFDEVADTEEQLQTRAPVVCVMGHVDHGKTSILDAIRHANVTAGEAGGITQHIGAYRVNVNGRDMTFLDTPGHEAFTAMRARGAMATDIAILVVAADDGVMPQTVEAINPAKAAGIEIVVAINKMDKPSANPDAIKQELTKYDLVPEEWGGDVICVPVSALKHEGIDELLETVLLVADMKDLKANPDRRAKGIVIEAKLDKGRGPVATVLVQNGTLRNGDIIIAGTAVGRVRSMTDHNGKQLKEAAPSVPVEITGLAEVPSSGDEFQAVEDERMARTLADQRRDSAKEEVFRANARASLNDLFAQISEGVKNLNVIVKADVGGSVEAVKQSLEKLSNEEVKVRVIHAAAGGITEGDVTFAAASDAIIVGFNVRPDKSALDSAERQNVEIRTYRVIYECIEEIEAAMKGMLAPKFKETLLGHAEVRQTIHVPSVGTIAGCYVQDGKITRQSQIRVLRDSVVIFEDKISSLKRFKDDAKEVASGYECGVGLEKFNDIKVGDVLEAFIMEQIEVK